MENAVDALKMSFAVLVFIAALSLAMYSFTRVRQTSETITQQSDSKEYYDQLRLNETEGGVQANSALAASSREVGVETVIPTLYRYYKENYTVLFYRGIGYNSSNGNFEKIEPLVLYYTESDDSYIKNSSLIAPNTGGRGIYGFDTQDEQLRNEPWNATEETGYKFVQAFINGVNTERYYTSKTTASSSHNHISIDSMYGPYYMINFGDNYLKGLIGKKYKFIERYGEYNYSNVVSTPNEDEEDYDYDISTDITSSADVLENGEIVENNKGSTKRVIQYILID